MGDWLTPLMQIGGAIAGNAMQTRNDERQLNQQEKLLQMQSKFNKDNQMFGMNLQKQMWENTSYPAQMEMMKRAGLNPGLLYGQSGGGGITTGSLAGNVGSASAPSGGNEIRDMMGIGLQIANQTKLLDAQVEALKADANAKNANADKTRGIDTEKTGTEIQSLTQGIENAKAQKLLTQAQTNLTNIETKGLNESFDNRMEIIKENATEAMFRASRAGMEYSIDKSTIDDKIKIIRQSAINAVLQNVLTKSKNSNINASTNLIKEQTYKTSWDVKKLANDIDMSWENLDVDKKRLMIDEKFKQLNLDKDERQQVIDVFDMLLGVGMKKFYPFHK